MRIPDAHVMPIDDHVKHEVSEECVCRPTAEAVKRSDGSVGRVYVHHALDGREHEEGDR